MSTRRGAAVLAFVAVLSGDAVAQTTGESEAAAPAAAAVDGAAAFDRFRAAYDPAADDPAVLAGMAGAAAELGDLARFRAVLDSVVSSGAGGSNALSYWGALSLQADLGADSVRAVFDAYLDRSPRDRSALVSFFRVLTAHGVLPAAEKLLNDAVRRGVRPVAVAMMHGDLSEARGDPMSALDAYLLAMTEGETAAVTAAGKIEELLGRWPSDPPASAAADRLERASGAAPANLLIPLVVRAWVTHRDWERAIAAAQDPALVPEGRGELLRSVAALAREAGDLAAGRALETLLALGPPAARESDRVLLAEIARDHGDFDGAAAELRRAAEAGVEGAHASALAAEVAASRETGDAAMLAETLDRAIAGGVDPALVGVPRGDLWLARGAPDSALAAYARGVGKEVAGPATLEALARVRLLQSLLRARVARETYAELGRTLVEAPAGPATAAARLDSLSAVVDTPTAGAATAVEIARSLLAGLAGEWRGRAGDPAGASEMLQRAAERAGATGEAPALLLAAGRWADAAGDPRRAAALWREVVERDAGSPYALEARRLLAAAGPPDVSAPPTGPGNGQALP